MDDPGSPNRIIEYLKSHRAIRTGIYQFISLPVIILAILTQNMSAGPCNPGPALLVMMYAVLANAILVLVSLVIRFARGRQYVLPVLINLAALILVIAVSFLRDQVLKIK